MKPGKVISADPTNADQNGIDFGSADFGMDAITAMGTDPANASFASIATLASYLTTGYWNYNGEGAHHWASSTIRYNLGNLNASEQAEAISALNSWHDVANVNFVSTSGTANITFNHNGSKIAATNDNSRNGLMVSATIDISTDWDAPGIGAYRYQTYIHEIGHALGLGHQGPYNASATYGRDNLYTNDTWQYSVMSYFAQHNYAGSGGSTDRYVVTPQMADIYAMQTIYGTNFSTRTGDTVYGFNTNAGAAYDFSKGAFALTIVDDSGNDTIDASGFSANQVIDLTPGNWSNIGGFVHNVGIWLGTTIENAIGGSGSDTIIGNSGSNRLDGRGGGDTLTGGGGSDTFVFSPGYGVDTVTDFTHGTDLIDIRGYSAIKSFSQLMSYAVQTTSGDTVFGFGVGDSLVLKGVNKATLTAADFLFNGKLFVGDDLNGDGTADIVWANGSGVIDWLMSKGNVNGGNVLTATLATGWKPIGTGDFTGDGTADVLIRDKSGTVVDWIMRDGKVVDGNVLTTVLTSNWHLVGTGDFNADGTSDIAWQDTSGTVVDWIMKDGVTKSGNVVTTGLPLNWTAIGTGDFNGDKTSDILVRDTSGTVVDWLMKDGKAVSGNILTTGLPSNWTMVGTGDFNNDGTADILWQDDAGTVVNWIMKNGVPVAGNVVTTGLDAGWKVVKVGDFNGDGTADVLLKNGSTVVDWIMKEGKAIDGHVLTTTLDPGWMTA